MFGLLNPSFLCIILYWKSTCLYYRYAHHTRVFCWIITVTLLTLTNHSHAFLYTLTAEVIVTPASPPPPQHHRAYKTSLKRRILSHSLRSMQEIGKSDAGLNNNTIKIHTHTHISTSLFHHLCVPDPFPLKFEHVLLH